MATKKKSAQQIKAERLKNLKKAREAKAKKEQKRAFKPTLTGKQIAERHKKRATSWAKRPKVETKASAPKQKRVKKAKVQREIVGWYDAGMGRLKEVTLPKGEKKKFQQAVAKTPSVFTKGRSVKELVIDWKTKSKPAKLNPKTGKYYREWVGKDGKKHREYRVNRLDYKWGI